MKDKVRKSHKLNARTFAVRQGDAIYVTVPVLVYRNRGNPSQKAGFKYMSDLIDKGLADQFQTTEITTMWCSMDPHNSESGVGADGDDDDK